MQLMLTRQQSEVVRAAGYTVGEVDLAMLARVTRRIVDNTSAGYGAAKSNIVHCCQVGPRCRLNTAWAPRAMPHT